MPSMTCSCGHTFGTGSFPNSNAYLAISEQDYDGLGTLEAKEPLDRLLFSSTRIYQCSQCEELIVIWKDSKEPQFFSKH